MGWGFKPKGPSGRWRNVSTKPSRRLSARRRLRRPVEATLVLCAEDEIVGWIVDEQDDGLGMMFGGPDVARLEGHADCCVGGVGDLWLSNPEGEDRPVPVRLAHVTVLDRPGTCRAGLAYEVRRMAPEDITHLMAVWRTLMHPERNQPDSSAPRV